MTSTKNVLNRHMKNFDAGDLQAVLSDYAPDAVFFTPDGTLRGT
jgi:ketosteroid isomerase-like protein